MRSIAGGSAFRAAAARLTLVKQKRIVQGEAMGRLGQLQAIGASAVMLIAAPATAQEARSSVVDDLAACRAVADPAARLACFDKTAAALIAARERKDVVVLDREEVRKTRRSLFGFTLPRIKLFGDGEDDAEAIKELTGTAASVVPAERDFYAVKLDDGSRWQTIEAARFPPKAGQTVRIKRAAMGSFMAAFNGGRWVRVKRTD
jgi:hypothetical protein